jgi:hypothetical protein
MNVPISPNYLFYLLHLWGLLANLHYGHISTINFIFIHLLKNGVPECLT